MSKAEDKALKVYPKMSRITEPHGVIPADYESHYIGDANEEKRMGFIEGYHQAEKDLELTWENMFDIFHLVNEVLDDYADGKTKKEVGEEVLKRFKEEKEKIDN